MDIHLEYMRQMDKNYGISEGGSERRKVNILGVDKIQIISLLH